jgi:hypothetical protein
MQIIKSALFLILFGKINISFGQSTFFSIGSREYHTIDRLDIKNLDSAKLNLFATKPYSRKEITNYAQWLDSNYNHTRNKEGFDLSPVDRYNMDKIMMGNTEWLNKTTNKYNSKKPFWNNYYKTKNNLYEVNTNDFNLVINPVIQQVQSIETNNKKRVYLNSKGLELRGMIGKKIGFYSYLTDNQENGADFYRQRVDSLKAAQGVGFYKPFKYSNGTDKGQDYFDYRGYITFKLAKLIDVQYGYDKNFIGNGYRSLFLSDVAAPALYLKMNTKIWKLNYQNLFMELAPTTKVNDGSAILQKKYAAMHHLSMNISDNFTLGLFESVIFKRRNKFEFGYLVPVIFYRAVESGLGSGDNALVGADFKVNFDQHFQLYGQLLLDEFKLSEIKKKSWANKIGGQGGLKYIDVAGIKNLDAQFEWNIVRPYTYSHFDSATTYTHYNQPLAHPLGANFSDVVAIVRYQPTNRLYFESRMFVMKQGQDRNLKQDSTWGGNIFREYTKRLGDQNNQTLGQGLVAKTINLNFLGSYEIKPNLFLEGSLQFRNFRKENQKTINTLMLSMGVRWNMNRREFDY